MGALVENMLIPTIMPNGRKHQRHSMDGFYWMKNVLQGRDDGIGITVLLDRDTMEIEKKENNQNQRCSVLDSQSHYQ